MATARTAGTARATEETIVTVRVAKNYQLPSGGLYLCEICAAANSVLQQALRSLQRIAANQISALSSATHSSVTPPHSAGLRLVRQECI